MRKFSLITERPHEGKRLDQLLADWLPGAAGEAISKAKVRKLIVAGAVYLNRRRVRIASKTIAPGARVDLFYDPEKLRAGDATEADRVFRMAESHILFEDEDLIAVDKPAGLPTQPTVDEARANLYAAVKAFRAGRDGPGAYVGLHHRLDRDTSGVVLTKTKRANAGVARAFAEHDARKRYLALCRVGSSHSLSREQTFTVENFLGQDPAGRSRGLFRSVRSGGDPARTDFRVLEVSGHGLCIEARPLTGRTHQIRVHLSELGLPIFGDSFYGPGSSSGHGPSIVQPGPASPPRPPSPPRMMLHARELALPHPVSGKSLELKSSLPADFQAFLEKLALLGRY